MRRAGLSRVGGRVRSVNAVRGGRVRVPDPSPSPRKVSAS